MLSLLSANSQCTKDVQRGWCNRDCRALPAKQPPAELASYTSQMLASLILLLGVPALLL